MKDSFATLFPAYPHTKMSALHGNPIMEHRFYKPYEKDLLGNPITQIDREVFRKPDAVKEYADAMARVASIKRIYKAWYYTFF